MTRLKIVFLSLLFTSLCLNTFSQMHYPETKTIKQSDMYHGVKVDDPYSWLEDDNSPETKEWVQNQNKLTFDYLSQISYRDKIKARLTTLWNYDKMNTIYKKGKLFFSFRNNGLQNQSVFYSQASLLHEPLLF